MTRNTLMSEDMREYTMWMTPTEAKGFEALGFYPYPVKKEITEKKEEDTTTKKKKIKLDKDIIEEYLEFLKKSMGTVKDKTFPTPSTPWPDYPWTVLVYDGAPSGRIFF